RRKHNTAAASMPARCALTYANDADILREQIRLIDRSSRLSIDLLAMPVRACLDITYSAGTLTTNLRQKLDIPDRMSGKLWLPYSLGQFLRSAHVRCVDRQDQIIVDDVVHQSLD